MYAEGGFEDRQHPWSYHGVVQAQVLLASVPRRGVNSQDKVFLMIIMSMCHICTLSTLLMLGAWTKLQVAASWCTSAHCLQKVCSDLSLPACPHALMPPSSVLHPSLPPFWVTVPCTGATVLLCYCAFCAFVLAHSCTCFHLHHPRSLIGMPSCALLHSRLPSLALTPALLPCIYHALPPCTLYHHTLTSSLLTPSHFMSRSLFCYLSFWYNDIDSITIYMLAR